MVRYWKHTESGKLKVNIDDNHPGWLWQEIGALEFKDLKTKQEKQEECKHIHQFDTYNFEPIICNFCPLCGKRLREE